MIDALQIMIWERRELEDIADFWSRVNEGLVGLAKENRMATVIFMPDSKTITVVHAPRVEQPRQTGQPMVFPAEILRRIGG